jgi:hypothetical protein
LQEVVTVAILAKAGTGSEAEETGHQVGTSHKQFFGVTGYSKVTT